MEGRHALPGNHKHRQIHLDIVRLTMSANNFTLPLESVAMSFCFFNA